MSYRYGPDRYKDGSLVNHWVEPTAPEAASEMVERAARAAFKNHHEIQGLPASDQAWAVTAEKWLGAQRAAIEAMREPTFDPESVSYHAGMTRADWWRAMIDEALK